MKAKKKKGKFPGEIAVDLNTCVIHLYPGSSVDAPVNYAGAALAEIALSDGSVGGQKTQFLLSFFPDGTKFPGPSHDLKQDAVLMFFNWGRFEAVKALIQQSETIAGIYNELDGPWADLDCVLKVGPSKASLKKAKRASR